MSSTLNCAAVDIPSTLVKPMIRQNEKLYVQVTQRIASPKTEKREYERLLDIRDNYPKYVLRTDEFAGGNYEDIITMHVADFLLSDKY